MKTSTGFSRPLAPGEFERLYTSGDLHPTLTLVGIPNCSTLREAREVMVSVGEASRFTGVSVRKVPDRVVRRYIYQCFGTKFRLRETSEINA